MRTSSVATKITFAGVGIAGPDVLERSFVAKGDES